MYILSEHAWLQIFDTKNPQNQTLGTGAIVQWLRPLPARFDS